MPRASLAALAVRDGGRPGENARLDIANSLRRVLVIDDGFNDQLLRSAHGLVQLRRPPLIIVGKQVDGPEQIDGGVGIGDLPQRRLRLGALRLAQRRTEAEQRGNGREDAME